MAQEIKATLKLDGEAKFKQAIKGAKTELTALKAEMKAQVAAFKAQGDAMGAAQAEADGLKAQQEQQAEIVRALQQALEEATAKYGENSQQVQSYRIQLANAQTSLAEMGMAADEAGASVASMGEDMSSAGDEIEDVGEEGADALSEIVDALNDIRENSDFSTLCEKVKLVGDAAMTAYEGVKKLYDMVNKSANWADDLGDKSEQTGIDVETLQAMEYAAQLYGSSVDDIIASVRKLKSNMDKEDDMRKLATMLGINPNDQNGLKDGMTFFNDVMKAARDAGVDLTKDTAAAEMFMDVFGKGADELQPLINHWDEYTDKVEEAKNTDGLIVSEEEVETLNNYKDSLDLLTTSMDTLERVWSSTLAPVFEAFNNGLATVLQDITAWLRDGDVAKSLEGVTQTIGDVMGMISQMASGDISFKDLLDTMTEWLSADGEGSFTQMLSNGIVNIIWLICDGITSLFAEGEDGTSVFGTLMTAAGSFVSGIFSSILTALDTLVNSSESDLPGTLSAAVKGLLDAFCSAVEALFSFTDNPAATTMMSNIESFIEQLIGGVFDGILQFIDGKLGTNFSGSNEPTIVNADHPDAWVPEMKETNGWMWFTNAMSNFISSSAANFWNSGLPTAGTNVGALSNGQLANAFSGGVLGDIYADLSEESIEGISDDVSAAIDDAETDVDVTMSEGSVADLTGAVTNALGSVKYTVPVYGEFMGITGGGSGGGTRGINWAGSLPGHADGLDYVPYDDYVARLHKGETVLTASQAAAYRNGGNVDLDRLAAKIVSGMNGITFQLDGRAVGASVAPTVNELLAASM